MDRLRAKSVALTERFIALVDEHLVPRGFELRSPRDPDLRGAHVSLFHPDALARGLSHEGKAYDFDFDFTRSDRMVCTEVVYRTYDGVGGMAFELKRRAVRLGAEELAKNPKDVVMRDLASSLWGHG